MANYTEHYGLHQWVPEDDFLRTDFNTDFALIDAALAGLAAADGAESAARSQEDGALSAAITAGDNAQASALASAKTALQNAITSGDNAQASALAAAKTALQNAINSGDNALDAAKAELVTGSYTGDGAMSRAFTLGFQPKALLLVEQRGWSAGGSATTGGIAFPNIPVQRGETAGAVITATGFQVARGELNYYQTYEVDCNRESVVYVYLALR